MTLSIHQIVGGSCNHKFKFEGDVLEKEITSLTKLEEFVDEMLKKAKVQLDQSRLFRQNFRTIAKN